MRWILTAVLIAGCGRPQWPGDPALHGVDLIAPAGSAAAVLHVMDGVASRWGLLPVAGYAGLRVVLRPGEVICSDRRSIGCYDRGDNTATASTDGAACVEQTLLAHELLHYVLEVATGDMDAGHVSHRWDELADLNLQLQREAGCAVY